MVSLDPKVHVLIYTCVRDCDYWNMITLAGEKWLY